MREVWRTERLPDWKKKIETPSFVATYKATFGEWMKTVKTQVEVMEAVEVEARRITDIVEWSFQKALDEGSQKELDTKNVGPKSTPMLDSAMRMLDGHRKTCETNLKLEVVLVSFQEGNEKHEGRRGPVRSD